MLYGDRLSALQAKYEMFGSMPAELQEWEQIESERDENTFEVMDCFNKTMTENGAPISEIMNYCAVKGIQDVERMVSLVNAAAHEWSKTRSEKAKMKG